MPKYYPVNLNLKGRKCVVIGGGGVAERKVRRLLDCGAGVRIISPEITPGLKKLVKAKKIVFRNRRVSLKDISGAYLVVSAAGERKINSFVSSYCRRKGILINVVDSPRECSFILPSVVRRGDLSISISTAGIIPALSKKIRRDLEKIFGPEYAKLLKIMKELRPRAIRRIKDARSRKAFFEKAAGSGVLKLLKKNKERQAREKLERILRNYDD